MYNNFMEYFSLFKVLFSLIMIGILILDCPWFYYFYGPLSDTKNLFKGKLSLHLLWVIWLVAVIGLISSTITIFSSFILMILSWYFYMFRKKNDTLLIRTGIEGKLIYFCSQYIFLIELTYFYFSDYKIMFLLFFLLKLEIAIIMISGGLYKFFNGGLHYFGLEYTLVNPLYGRLYFLFNHLNPRHFLFRFINYNAIFVEIFSGILLLVTQTKLFGVILLISVFIFSMVTVRLVIIPLLMFNIALILISDHSLQYFSTLTYIQSMPINPSSLIMIKIFICVCIILLALIGLVINTNLRVTFNKFSWFCFLSSFFNLFFISANQYSVFSARKMNVFVKIYQLNNIDFSIKKIHFDGYSKYFFNRFFSFRSLLFFSRNIAICTTIFLFHDNIKDYLKSPQKDKLIKYAQILVGDNSSKDIVFIQRYNILNKQDSFCYVKLVDITIDLGKQTVSIQTNSNNLDIPIRSLHDT